MNKNIAISAIALISVLIVGRYILAVLFDSGRFDPVLIMESETQSCTIPKECTFFQPYCGGGCDVAISIHNADRYDKLRKQHCELNPPTTTYYASCSNNGVTCKNNICEMTQLSKVKIMSAVESKLMTKPSI